MGNSNNPGQQLPTVAPEPAPGTALMYDAGMTLASTAAELVAIINCPRGTTAVQLLPRTYDLTGLVPAKVIVSFHMFCIGPGPAVVTGTATQQLWLKGDMRCLKFEGVAIELDGLGLQRLERVTICGPVTSTSVSRNLCLKDCIFNSSVNLGDGTFTLIDNEFLSTVCMIPRYETVLTTNIFNEALTIKDSTITTSLTFLYGNLFRVPAGSAGVTTMLDITTSNQTYVQSTVFDLEKDVTPADVNSVVRIYTDTDGILFLRGMTFDPEPDLKHAVVISAGAGRINVGVSNLKPAQFSGAFSS